MKKYIIYIFPIVIALLQTSCNKEETDWVDRGKMHLQVTAIGNHPDFKTDLFPSVLYLAEGLKEYYKEEAGEIFTDQVLELTFANPGRGSNLTLDMRETPLTEPLRWQYTTGDDENIRIMLPVKWKYKSLQSWNKTEKISFIWDVKINNWESGTLNQTFTCHDVGRFPDRIITRDRAFVGTLSVDAEGAIYPAAIIPSYIDENNPLIDELLQGAITDGAIDRFDGYARGDKQIVEQLGAMWYILLKNGMTYGNHYFVPGYWSERHIRKLRSINEILDSHTGNCMELPIILLSMCHRIGLKGVSFHVEVYPQDHMYMGIQNEQGELTYLLNPAYLEQMDWEGKTNEQRVSLAKKQLVSLLEVGRLEHQLYSPQIIIGAPHFEQIDLEAVRRVIPSLHDKNKRQ